MSMIYTLLAGNIGGILAGYAICVLFPIPFVNSFVISMWGKLFKKSTPIVVSTGV